MSLYSRIKKALLTGLLTGILLLTGIESTWAFIGMVTGDKTGTYYRFGQDISRVAQRQGLDIQVKASEGSISNIERMNSRENAAFGIVQSDVLGFLYHKRPDLAKRLSMIYPFYSEEVHILTRKTITDFSELKDKKIATGTKGSGNWLTLANLMNIMGVKPAEEVTRLTPLEAVIAVLEGKIDAMIYVAGKPVNLFKKLEKLNQNPKYRPLIEAVHFLPIANSKMLKEYYITSRINAADYGWVEEDVPTIAVKALLVTFDFSSGHSAYYRERCRQIRSMASIIRKNLSYLKQNGHPKWQGVDLDMEIGRWKRDLCAHPSSSRPPKNELYDTLKEMFEQPDN